METTKKDWRLEFPFEWMFNTVQQEMKVRLSIFILTGVCAGLPALVWSVRDIIHHRKNGHRISIFIILLLLTDFLELLLSPYILIKLHSDQLEFWSTDWIHRVIWSLRLSSKVYGLLLNQLVALEGILTVKYPQYTTSVFSSTCFRIFHILIVICMTISGGLLYFVSQILHLLIIIFTVFIASEITWIIFCIAMCSADRHSRISSKPDPHVLVIFIVTLLMFYPYLILSILCLYNSYLHIPRHIITIPEVLVCLRLISDPLLCVLLCWQKLSVQSQNPE